jgi:hypothetical protein
MKTTVFVMRHRRVLQKVSVIKEEAATFKLEFHPEDEASSSLRNVCSFTIWHGIIHLKLFIFTAKLIL